MLPVLVEDYTQLSYSLLIDISSKKDPCYHFLLDKNSRTALNKIKPDFESDPDEAFEILRKWMNDHEEYPPLEMIYWFHSENLIFVTTYFYRNKHYCDYFYELFKEIYCQNLESEEDRIKKIISTVASAIINCLIHTNEELQLLAEEISSNLISKIEELIRDSSLKKSPISDMKKYTVLNEECLKKFAHLHLKNLISSPSDFSLNEVVELHVKQWTSNYLSSTVLEHINQVLSHITAKEVIHELKEGIVDFDFNWKNLLIICSVFIKSQEGAATVKEMVDTWLKLSFEEDNLQGLYLPVLLARHCCYERARYFQSYAHWFSSLNLKTSKNFSLFIKFLSEILPYELPLYLKIHLNKVPSAPHGCQSILVDYLVLAKTRLADLNESNDYIGLFSDHHETDEKGQQADIARVIAHYVENKEIAKPLLEAYVLRRQYYEKVFLKQLLKVPESEDANRAQVIRQLYSMGKISTALFNNWSKL